MKGPALLLAGIVSFSLLDATGKLLSGTYPLAQAVALRWVVVILLILAGKAIWPALGGPLRTGFVRLHRLRSGIMVASAAGFYMGFRQVALAEGYLVFFTAPFMTLAMTPLLLREKVPAAAWFWSAVGFGGVLVSVLQRLGEGGSLAGYLWILMGTFFFSLTQALNRMMREEAGWARMVFWGALAGLAAYGPPAALHWVPPTTTHWAMLLANGVFAGGGVVLTALAYQAADAARLGPFGFAALPCSVLLDLLLWGTPPDAMTILGGGIVVLACAMSERASRRAALQAMLAGKTCSPSGPSGSGVTARTAASGNAP